MIAGALVIWPYAIGTTWWAIPLVVLSWVLAVGFAADRLREV